jgi:MFS family permease
MDGPIATSQAGGRPTDLLPKRELFRISLYWLGLSSIFAGLAFILGARLEFDGLVPDTAEAGRTLFLLTIAGALIAVVVQPTIGTISDYTISRWGRRKPYILIGSLLDVVFLAGIAISQDLLAIAAFVALLQFSSNFAQGPFQGYIPDLVPAPQVGFASALVGMMQILGNVSGYLIAAIAVAIDQFALGLIALGVLEVATMLSVVIRVREGTAPKPRGGRSWLSIASEAWGTDILRERSFLWLVASRFAVLMAGGVLANLAVFYLARSLAMNQEEAGLAYIPLVGLVALGTVIAVVPAARISDRVGRKKVIYVSCAVGAVGLGLVAIAPSFPLALIGTGIFGLSTGIFLAVDWALMTDIIPKASSGRYMGLSNVATATSGVFAIAIGGTLMDVVGGPAGPRAALWMAVVLFGVGSVLLRPVDERRREDFPDSTHLEDEPAIAPALSEAASAEAI